RNSAGFRTGCEQVHATEPKATSDPLAWDLATLYGLAKCACRHAKHLSCTVDVEEFVLQCAAKLVAHSLGDDALEEHTHLWRFEPRGQVCCQVDHAACPRNPSRTGRSAASTAAVSRSRMMYTPDLP